VEEDSQLYWIRHRYLCSPIWSPAWRASDVCWYGHRAHEGVSVRRPATPTAAFVGVGLIFVVEERVYAEAPQLASQRVHEPGV